jgi:hypothetical protein
MTQRSSDFPPRHGISRARFFLERAEECSVDEREAFEAYLEAAIIFGRTAMDRLNRKYEKKIGKHKEWWDSLLENASVKFFKDARDFIVHEGPWPFNQIILATPLHLHADLTPLEGNRPDPTEVRGHTVTEADDSNSRTRAADLYYIEDEKPPATATVRRHLEQTTPLVTKAEARLQP